MSFEGNRYMWLFVFFDLPVKTKEEKRIALKFRHFLLQDGYMMIQFSVYARLCNGRERIEKHLKKLESKTPEKGNVRCFEITDMQYSRMKLLVGERVNNEKKRAKQLLLF